MANDHDHPNIPKNVHPPVVALLCIVLAYVLGRLLPLPFGMREALRNIGLLLAFVGFLLGLAAFVEFRKALTTLDPHGSSKQIVTSGIYRLSRNPIYLGFLLMVVGIPLTSGSYWGIVLAPFYVMLMDHLVIQYEERYLEKKFGKTYTSYASRVRRWL
jgi:protein-S-isoprenylcysteine O-methyltransferase Ste14